MSWPMMCKQILIDHAGGPDSDFNWSFNGRKNSNENGPHFKAAYGKLIVIDIAPVANSSAGLAMCFVV